MSVETEMRLLKLIEEFRAKAREKKSDDIQAQFYEAYAAGINRAIAEIRKAEKQSEEKT